MMKQIDCGGPASPPKINECLRGRSDKYRRHSKGEPDGSTRNCIHVRFAIALPVAVKIKLSIKTPGDGALTGLATAPGSPAKPTCEPSHESL
jgi:hypothetical protein